MQVSDDEMIFIKIGMTKDPRSRISNYITHHLGETPPVYYKIWQVQNEKAEEDQALRHFEERRVKKAGNVLPSEVIRATKAEIEAYSPQDPQKRAIAPHTMMPSERYIIRHDAAQRFEEHWEELSEIQSEVITEIAAFLRTKGDARKLRAPCGTGKTHMTCEAIRQVAADDPTLKVCVLCPTKLIADQWRGNFYRLGMNAPILVKSDLQEKDGTPKEDHTGHRFRIVTYASCSALCADAAWTYIFDEAHHTCGSIEGSDGVTKRLANETATAGCSRLFLTFTPKNYVDHKHNSMDNPAIYGSDIPFPSMQDLVRKGLMPDYRLTLTYRNYGETLIAVCDEMKDAKKIVVCLQSIEDIEEAQVFLEGYDKNVYAVHGGMSNEHVAESIENFRRHTSRSWLLSCLVLLEGADIPEADTVALLAPWKTETRLIQLLLRPGRWCPKKTTFNIVAPKDDGNHIENNLRIAGFEVIPRKICHLRATSHSSPSPRKTPLEVVRSSSHVWCVSFTEKHSVEGGLTPAKSDFDIAIEKSQISAAQVGLDRAKQGDLVILRGPSNVAFASVIDVRTTTDTLEDGKSKKRTVMDVEYLPVQWNSAGTTRKTSEKNPIFLTVKQYRECICSMWDGREDRDWICNPRFTGNFKYDAERRALIEQVIDRSIDPSTQSS
jgi:hypothetical protein